ncbi:hypothetical protein AAC387_Pa12g0927 [Persea americana]
MALKGKAAKIESALEKQEARLKEEFLAEHNSIMGEEPYLWFPLAFLRKPVRRRAPPPRHLQRPLRLPTPSLKTPLCPRSRPLLKPLLRRLAYPKRARLFLKPPQPCLRPARSCLRLL